MFGAALLAPPFAVVGILAVRKYLRSSGTIMASILNRKLRTPFGTNL